MAAIEVNNLQHVYPDGTVALHDVSFRIHHGESVAIIGANGAGKSTLLLHLNGYLSATSGEIVIGDTLLAKENLAEIRPMVFAVTKLQQPVCRNIDIRFRGRRRGAGYQRR